MPSVRSRVIGNLAIRYLFIVFVAFVLLGGCGGRDSQTVSVETQQSLMSRWNRVATGITVPLFPGGPPVDFLWNAFDKFPHPTFRGGSAAAYEAFANILIAFYENGDNFAFLSESRLFRITLSSTLANGMPGVDTTFEQITSQLSSDAWAPLVSAGVRQQLGMFIAKISASS